MKNKDIPNVQYKITNAHFENLFDVYEEEDEKYFYNLLKTVNMPKDLDPIYYDNYVVKYGDMWPTISYAFYGNVVLWWLICATNQVMNPTVAPEVGAVIKIIKPSYVPEILNKLS